MSDNAPPDVEKIGKLKEAYDKLVEQIHTTVIGQDSVIEELLISIFAGGHCILEGVPGLAKTLLVSTLAKSLSLDFGRIQFTPDLMPADITGTEVIYEDPETKARQFKFIEGPLFTNLLLADEINRTPPKTQSALLQGMQERQVSAGGHMYDLPSPFFVLATQNPIEQEGTYPLPEAQLDRFLMKVVVKYPTRDEEREIYKQITGIAESNPEPVMHGEEVLEIQRLVRRVPISDLLVDYTMNLIRATRRDEDEAPQFVRDWVQWGIGPRGGQSLILAAKARAALYGRPEVDAEDLQKVAPAVLRHRILVNYTAEAAGESPDTVIGRLIEETPITSSPKAHDERLQRVLQ
ncbi:MAG: AAA family ATPase [Planctomycetales bacterium]|nr:AAA family ATPase [Planctomycetales bacterium]